MASPSSRQNLIDYCLRQLGHPVLEINIDDDQIEDRIDEIREIARKFRVPSSQLFEFVCGIENEINAISGMENEIKIIEITKENFKAIQIINLSYLNFKNLNLHSYNYFFTKIDSLSYRSA